jgi:hypothetical protein
MANVLTGSNDKEKLDDLITRTHKDQAVWFLNAVWEVPPAVTGFSRFLSSIFGGLGLPFILEARKTNLFGPYV